MTNSTTVPSASLTSATITMFYEPTQTFRQLESRPRSWFPTLLLILCSLVVMSWYMSMVDFPWLIDQMSAVMPAAEREMFAKAMSKTMMQWSTIGSVAVMFPLMFAITGVYLMLVSKTLGTGMSFGKGYALAAWASIPGILLLPLGIMQIMLNPAGQFDFSALNPLSLNQLLFNYPIGHKLAGIMDALSLPMFWNVFLLVIGFEVWAKVKRATAIKVVLIPHVVVFGAWITIAMATGA